MRLHIYVLLFFAAIFMTTAKADNFPQAGDTSLGVGLQTNEGLLGDILDDSFTAYRLGYFTSNTFMPYGAISIVSNGGDIFELTGGTRIYGQGMDLNSDDFRTFFSGEVSFLSVDEGVEGAIDEDSLRLFGGAGGEYYLSRNFSLSLTVGASIRMPDDDDRDTIINLGSSRFDTSMYF